MQGEEERGRTTGVAGLEDKLDGDAKAIYLDRRESRCWGRGREEKGK